MGARVPTGPHAASGPFSGRQTPDAHGPGLLSCGELGPQSNPGSHPSCIVRYVAA